jgi:hypothetical protein
MKIIPIGSKFVIKSPTLISLITSNRGIQVPVVIRTPNTEIIIITDTIKKMPDIPTDTKDIFRKSDFEFTYFQYIRNRDISPNGKFKIDGNAL